MEDDLKMVKSMLRSVLISCKEGVAAMTLQREYKEIVGDFLPYKKFGYSCLEDFILSMPDVVRISRRGQDVMCHAVADESTQHIQNLVSKQRSKKPKKPVRRPRGGGGGSGFLTSRPRGRPRTFQPNYASRPAPPPTDWPSTPRQAVAPPYVRNQPLTPVTIHIGNSSSGSRTIRLGENPLLARTMKDVHASRGYQYMLPHYWRAPRPPMYRMKSGYETPPRFRKQNAGQQESPPSPPSVQPSAPPSQRKGGRPTKKREYAKIEDGVDYMSKLKTLLRDMRVNHDCETAEGYGGYASSITINKTRYGSEGVYATAAEAQQAAAKVALSKLDTKKTQVSQYAEIIDWEDTYSQVPAAASIPPAKLAKVKSRIQEVLKDRVNGLWGTVIPFEYRRRFNEEAPQEILEIVKTWPDIAKVELVPNTEREIVYPVVDDSNKDLVIPYEQYIKSCDEKVIVYMTFIHHPSFFCVQRDDSTIDEMSEKLQAYCKSKNAPDRSQLHKDQYCAGLYSGDKNWTRAQILDIRENNNVEVMFVDYGNCETVKVGDIRWLSPETANYPVQAITCSLYGIQPLEDESKWSQKSLTTFAELVQDQELVAIPKCLYDDLVEVDLYLKTDQSESIADKLVKAGVVRSVREKMAELEKNDPELIVLPDEKHWDVYIAHINASTNSVMVRLIGAEYSDRLEVYKDTLEQAWKSCDTEAPVIEGGTYVVFDEELYHRVRVLSTEGRKMSCYFLDHGDSDEILPEQLRPLDPSINRQLPYQALEVSLYGLEDVCSNEEMNIVAIETLCEIALTKSCVAEVMERGPIPSIILYDTSGEKDININEAILEAVDPTSHSDTSSQTSKHADTLQHSQSASSIDQMTLQSDNSNSAVIDSLDITQQQTSLKIDNFGNSDVNGDISVRPKLATPYIPPPPPVDTTDICETQGDVRSPEVPEEDLSSQKSDIVTDIVVNPVPVVNDRNDNPVKKRPISKLELFPLPDVGAYFDVHVLFAHNPSDFTCVPYHKLDEMTELFKGMMDYYDGKPPVKMTAADIKIGEFYAGCCEDGLWYRVQAKHVISSDLVTMYQVDQGTYSALGMDEIQPLYRQFFSPQILAFKACLGGIEPINKGGSWTEGAKYKFMDMATHNDMVALVHDKNETTRTLNVSLVDTNGEVDICLEEVLVKMDFARFVDKAN